MMKVGERKLMGSSLAAVCMLLAGCELVPVRTDFSGLELAPGPHLLIDGYLIEAMSAVQRVVNPPQRSPSVPNPLVTGVEDQNFQPYFSILLDGGRFRLWYNVPPDGDATAHRSRLGYMESTDGIRWERPHRVLPDVPEGIRFGVSVVRRPEGGYALGFNQSGGLKVATSPDGFGWKLVHPKELIQHSHDISGLTYDPIRKQYIAIVSVMRPLDAGGFAPVLHRMTQQSVSRDLRNWEMPWDIVTPNYRDDEATQFYAVDGFLARGELLIGMVKVLRDDLNADGPGAGAPGGIGYTALAWSRDGRTWTRDRAIYLAPDPRAGTWDHAMAWVDEQVPVGDSVYLYYAGYATGHKGDKSRDRQIGLVTIPRDRYAGWEPRQGGGLIRSRLLRMRGSDLTFNVDASAGEVRVRVLDAHGRDALGKCEPIRGDHLDAPLRCDREVASLREPFRLEIGLNGARLYAWSVLE
jgi:hypothetical protein